MLWLNGRFVSPNEAAVFPLDRGFLYGDGIFETMRADTGRVLYLRDHLDRLFHSLQALRIEADLPLNWRELFHEILLQNGLLDEVATVKIIVTRGICPGLGTPKVTIPTICLTAQRYLGPDEVQYNRGWRLHIFREGYAPPLARFKTLNYLYFLTARQGALDHGADEALVLDPNGYITETASGSIIAKSKAKWWVPKSAYQLQGITIQKVVGLLREAGEVVEEKKATAEDLFFAETVWVLNSMMGIMPICELDGQRIPCLAAGEAVRLRRTLFERG